MGITAVAGSGIEVRAQRHPAPTIKVKLLCVFLALVLTVSETTFSAVQTVELQDLERLGRQAIESGNYGEAKRDLDLR
jgi:hypothetical protein